MHLRSFSEKSQHKFESLLFPSGEILNLHPLSWAGLFSTEIFGILRLKSLNFGVSV